MSQIPTDISQVPILGDLLIASLVIVPVGTVLIFLRCLTAMSNCEDEEISSYKKRIKNALIFCVLAESIVGILKIVELYFRKG